MFNLIYFQIFFVINFFNIFMFQNYKRAEIVGCNEKEFMNAKFNKNN